MEPKIGLALSGGGFRAAFFHVGVLARLAELGLLRQVEVLSTVSGGSIVGATYYVRLKRLLEATPDGELTDEDFCALVADVDRRLTAAVGRNIRARVFANPLKNVAMASPRYSRSDRIGDLYDRYLYKPAWEEPRPRRSWGRETQVELRELLVRPSGEPADFDPETGNAGRRAKVPILLLNATSLNSGNGWRFEAVRMGEPLPRDERLRAVVGEVDKNLRLEPGYFGARPDRPQVPERQRDFPLGLAVAASAGVPGLFQPLAISGMYEGIRVQLVDGGVHDNQGVQGLFDEGCTHLVISDASGQMQDAEHPSSRIPAVLSRSASISRDRVRDEQLIGVAARGRPFALMHLRKGLQGRAIAPGASLEEARRERRGDVACADFGVDARVQRALSEIRTDLDDFSAVEARCLALDGYRMSSHELRATGLDQLGGARLARDDGRWDFGAAAPVLEAPTRRDLRHLRAGRRRFFRLLTIVPALRLLPAGLAVLAAVAAWQGRDDLGDWLAGDWPRGLVLAVAIGLLAALAGYAASSARSALLRAPTDLLTTVLVPLVLALPLFAWATAVLLTGPLVRRAGRLRTPRERPAPTAPPAPAA